MEAGAVGRPGLYFECRRLAAERARSDAPADQSTLRTSAWPYMATTAILDRSGVRPIDHNLLQDVTSPTWEPSALTPEEREDLKPLLQRDGRERETVNVPAT
jgi:hypothetical protein